MDMTYYENEEQETSSTAIIMLLFTAMLCCYLAFHIFGGKTNKYVGQVQKVNEWDGTAKLKTKGCTGQDTIIVVTPLKNENFQVGQQLIVWSGVNKTGKITTQPPIR